MHRTSQRPLGEATRGKTARFRLRRLDRYIATVETGLLLREHGRFRGSLYVDLGFGWTPRTTMDSAEHFRRLNPNLAVLGVEIVPERVAEGDRYRDARTDFRLGGFDVPLRRGERVKLLRAMNVLRQYDEDAVPEAWAWMGKGLLPGGLIVEGTSCPFGRTLTANLIRKRPDGELALEGLLLSTNFRDGFHPRDLQPRLPKQLIHRVVPGDPTADFFDTWSRLFDEAAPLQIFGPRHRFAASVERLAQVFPLDHRSWLVHRGMVVWKRPPGPR